MALLTAASATGSSEKVSHGHRTLVVYGTWDGATAKLQMSPDEGSTWVDVTDASFTADGAVIVVLTYPMLLRMHIASAGGSTSLTAELI